MLFNENSDEPVDRTMRIFILLTVAGMFCANLFAYWEWTPKTGKWINPKYSVKDTDIEQWQHAESFRVSGNNEAAIREYNKLVKHYPLSLYAPKSLFEMAKIYSKSGDKDTAFSKLDEIVKRYPDFPEIEDVLKMQREISLEILQKKQLRLVEKFKDPSKKYEAITRTIESDPFNTETPPVALQLASRYAKSGEMEKAINLYQQVIRDFPGTQWAEKARYEMLIHQIKSIPQGTTDVSLFSSVEKQIDLFIVDFPSSPYKQKLLDTRTQLRNEIAGRLFKVAEIYSKNGKKKSAEIYYNKIKTLYPETEYAKKSTVNP